MQVLDVRGMQMDSRVLLVTEIALFQITHEI